MTRLRRLLAKRSARDADCVFVAEGAKVVEAALASGARIEAVYVESDALTSSSLGDLCAKAQEKGVRVIGLERGVIARIADAATPQPILAVVNYLDRPLGQVMTGVVLVLVDVRDPGNIGAIVRSSDGAGVNAVILCDGCGDIYNPKTVRASAGSLFHLPIVRGGTREAVIASLKERGFVTMATLSRGGEDYDEVALVEPLAVVFGNEARGLDEETVALCDRQLTIPIAGGAESLNVAMAATIVTFEIARRRRHGDGRLA